MQQIGCVVCVCVTILKSAALHLNGALLSIHRNAFCSPCWCQCPSSHPGGRVAQGVCPWWRGCLKLPVSLVAALLLGQLGTDDCGKRHKGKGTM